MHLHLIDLDNAVNDGVDRESAHGVNVQFARDVFAVREDRVDRQEKMRRNLLVGKPFDDVSDDFSLTFGERVGVIFVVGQVGLVGNALLDRKSVV